MAGSITARGWAGFSMAILCLMIPNLCRADAATQPSTQPTSSKTGAFDITFTQRSPQSTPSELARRLNLKPRDVANDYDLSKRPYRIYVPKNYDPAMPCGIFVYLGYKDSVSTPPTWNAALDRAHMIFITPVCHSGAHYPNPVPLWQSVGMALDAVYNLKKQYAIDDRRIYMMSITDDGLSEAIAMSDAFRGFLISDVYRFWRTIPVGNGGYYLPDMAAPPDDMLSSARNCSFFVIDEGDDPVRRKLVLGAMQEDGFQSPTVVPLSIITDLHYPNFAVDWLQKKALPFLDANSVPPSKTDITAATTQPAGAASTAAPDEPSPAQQELSLAQLYMTNGQSDLARTKLQEIIDTYPDDPAAAKAKDLLQQLNSQ
jgi:hypothetical protein